MTQPGLGLDIHEEILVRMQVKDLIRCKSVCKSWYSLISSGLFVKSHLNNIVKNKVDNNETGDTRITALTCTSMCVSDCWIERRRECQVVGSSNGLVCISRYATDFLVVNPSTREVKELRNPPKSYYNYSSARVSGFGYDSSIDDYKVVIGFFNKCTNKLSFEVLTLKSNTWRSVYVESGYGILYGNGIICNGAIHWYTCSNNGGVIVSFDLSKEVFKEIPHPKLVRPYWDLGTIEDCLCIFASPNINYRKHEDIEIWVMRKYNVQESWERKLPPPPCDTHKIMMHYIPREDFFNRHVHIWILEEGSCAPVLVRSIEHPDGELLDHNNSHIRLYTYPECNYNYAGHVFVKSLVSPHGMGNDNGSCNEERVKGKRQNVISPYGDGRSVKSRGESPVSRNSDGGRAKRTKKSLLFHDAECDGDGRRVERKRRERKSHVFYNSDKERSKSKIQGLLSSDSDCDGRRVERKRRERERERESLVFHSSDGGRAKSKWHRHVSFDSDDDGMRVERKRRERESLVCHSSDGGRAKSKTKRHVSSYSDDDGRRLERKRRETESLVFHSSDRGRSKSKRQSLVSYYSNGDGRRVERKRRERESHVFHTSDDGRAKSKRKNLVSSDSNHDGRRVEGRRRERSHNERER
ncbi:F-box/kelch-repeat protein-like protein isoform X1 [Tanacetum coccineum]